MGGLNPVQWTIVLVVAMLVILLLGSQLIAAVKDIQVAKRSTEPADTSPRALTGRLVTDDEARTGYITDRPGHQRTLDADELTHRRLVS